MTDDQARLRRPSNRPAQHAVRPVLLATVALLALASTGAWFFDLDGGGPVAALLAIVALGLVAVGIRAAFGNQEPGAATPTVRCAQAAGGSLQDQFRPSSLISTSDPLAALLGGSQWSLDVFAAIDAQRFAAVCETWFSWAGFDTRTQSHRTDAGVDIWLHAARMPGPVAIVRCKHWHNKSVGLQEMKEFRAVVASFQSAHGTYTTTSTYTPEALEFAKEHGIDTVDGRALLRRIQTRTRQRQQALLAVAYSGHS